MTYRHIGRLATRLLLQNRIRGPQSAVPVPMACVRSQDNLQRWGAVGKAAAQVSSQVKIFWWHL